ncbi:MAG: hypothetical protein IJT62_05685 [Oscillospiraceae bacterium]|nr:hypothetical protein [Oscillospiraceae bacterium]
MADNQFSLPELRAIFLALESQVENIRRHQSDPDFSTSDRNQLLDALKASRSAKKKVGLLIQSAEKVLSETPPAAG